MNMIFICVLWTRQLRFWEINLIGAHKKRIDEGNSIHLGSFYALQDIIFPDSEITAKPVLFCCQSWFIFSSNISSRLWGMLKCEVVMHRWEAKPLDVFFHCVLKLFICTFKTYALQYLKSFGQKKKCDWLNCISQPAGYLEPAWFSLEVLCGPTQLLLH